MIYELATLLIFNWLNGKWRTYVKQMIADAKPTVRTFDYRSFDWNVVQARIGRVHHRISTSIEPSSDMHTEFNERNECEVENSWMFIVFILLVFRLWLMIFCEPRFPATACGRLLYTHRQTHSSTPMCGFHAVFCREISLNSCLLKSFCCYLKWKYLDVSLSRRNLEKTSSHTVDTLLWPYECVCRVFCVSYSFRIAKQRREWENCELGIDFEGKFLFTVIEDVSRIIFGNSNTRSRFSRELFPTIRCIKASFKLTPNNRMKKKKWN